MENDFHVLVCPPAVPDEAVDPRDNAPHSGSVAWVSPPVIVSITGEIGMGKNTADKIIERIGDAAAVKFLINSPGGSCLDTFEIMKALANRRVEIEIRGHCCSAAAIITLIGDIVRIERGATMMLHQGRAMLSGNADDFQRAAERMREIDERMKAMVKAKLEIPEFVTDWSDGRERRFTAAEAVAVGLADSIFTDPAPYGTFPASKDANDESRIWDILRAVTNERDIRVSNKAKFANDVAVFIFHRSQQSTE